ncbi:MAG TPA: hypothetical protein VK914_10190 [bacterium]|nr:hypothetical protein [bacterium]
MEMVDIRRASFYGNWRRGGGYGNDKALGVPAQMAIQEIGGYNGVVQRHWLRGMVMTKITRGSLLLGAMVCTLSLNGCEHFLDGIYGSGAPRSILDHSQPQPTKAGYEMILNSWVGSSELDLVRKFGVPTQTYEVSGHRFLVYDCEISYRMPESYTTTYVGNTAYTDSYGGQVLTKSCTTTFESDGEKIVNFQDTGNDCRAVPPKYPQPQVEPTPSSDGLVHINAGNVH